MKVAGAILGLSILRSATTIPLPPSYVISGRSRDLKQLSLAQVALDFPKVARAYALWMEASSESYGTLCSSQEFCALIVSILGQEASFS